jgi:NAD(P)-dependent dehydrogenase (short-subunit alcohol dehydrogenase family)
MFGFVESIQGVRHLSSKMEGVKLIYEVVPSNMNPMGTGAGADIFGNSVEKVPAKRAGNLDDLAGIVLFLVSKAGAYVHGRSITIDGGRTLFANGQVKQET